MIMFKLHDLLWLLPARLPFSDGSPGAGPGSRPRPPREAQAAFELADPASRSSWPPPSRR